MAFSLSAVFGLDATGVKTELKQLRKEIGDFASQWGNIGAGAAAAAFVALSKSAIDLGSHISDTSVNLGIAAEAYQVMSFAATQAGLSNEKFDDSMAKVRKTVIDASEGNKEAVATLAKLGLTYRQLIGLPLEQQYLKIANATKNATDKNEAFNAITSIFGEKTGKKMMTVLTELAEQGYPKAAKAAKDAGQVMSNETIVALERAGDAIDAFKQKATIAVGNIIVNFRTTEGLELLLMEFLKIVDVFGAKIIDALSEANDFVRAVFVGTFTAVADKFKNLLINNLQEFAGLVNKILPSKFQIDVSGLDKFKSAGTDVSEEITRAIANTKPSTFTKDVSAYWDKAIADQKKVVDDLNHVDLGKDAKKLSDAGKAMERSGKVTAAAIEDGAGNAAKKLEDAAAKAAETFSQAASSLAQSTGQIFDQMAGQLNIIGALNGKTLAGMSDEALQSLVRQDKNKQVGLDPGTAFDYGDSFEIRRLQTEVLNAQRELDMRNKFRDDISGPGGVDANRDRYDPQIFEKLLQQFGPGAQDTSNRIANSLDKLNQQFAKGVPTVFFGNTSS